MKTRLIRPENARALLVLAHGAGAGMEHPFMEGLAGGLASRGIATFRFDFPYRESGKGWPPDPRAVLVDTVAEAVTSAGEAAPDLPLFAGGKSLGGRMTSEAAAEGRIGAGGRPPEARTPAPDTGGPLPPGESSPRKEGGAMAEPAVRGLVFFGFPLHTRRRPSTARARHLDRVNLPMLFLQGTRDALADLDLLRPVVGRLGPRATLHPVDGADHGFAVLQRSGRTDDEVMEELAKAAAGWILERASRAPTPPAP